MNTRSRKSTLAINEKKMVTNVDSPVIGHRRRFDKLKEKDLNIVELNSTKQSQTAKSQVTPKSLKKSVSFTKKRSAIVDKENIREQKENCASPVFKKKCFNNARIPLTDKIANLKCNSTPESLKKTASVTRKSSAVAEKENTPIPQNRSDLSISKKRDVKIANKTELKNNISKGKTAPKSLEKTASVTKKCFVIAKKNTPVPLKKSDVSISKKKDVKSANKTEIKNNISNSKGKIAPKSLEKSASLTKKRSAVAEKENTLVPLKRSDLSVSKKKDVKIADKKELKNNITNRKGKIAPNSLEKTASVTKKRSAVAEKKITSTQRKGSDLSISKKKNVDQIQLKNKTSNSKGQTPISLGKNGANTKFKSSEKKANISARKIETCSSPVFVARSKRKSIRLSKIQNKDIYDFLVEESNQDNKSKKKAKPRKPAVKKKAIKKKMLSGALTTDPGWKPPLKPVNTQKSFSTSSFYTQNSRTNYVTKRRRFSKSSISRNDSMFNFEDDFSCHSDDETGYEGGISVATDNGNETVNSISTLPTPHLNRNFAGTTSTPIAQNIKPVVQGTIENCFGFDDPEEEVVGFSPVEKASGLNALHTASLISNTDLQDPKNPAPSRFSVESIKINNTKLVNNTYLEKTYSKQRVLKNNSSKNKICRKPSKNMKTTETVTEENKANESVLFDEEELQEEVVPSSSLPSKTIDGSCVTNAKSSFLSHKANPSPQKSFTKPPRKSYDRKSLESAKQKLLSQLAGGAPNTDSDTEEESSSNRRPTNKRKKATLKNKNNQRTIKPRKKKKPTLEKSKENSAPSKKSKADKEAEKSILEWASDINSHFSEIEEMDLVVE